MLTKKKLFACLGIIIVGILALSGCASSSSGSSGSVLKTGPGVDVAHKTITLGILSPYSGPVAAPIGDPLALGVKVFFDHVNATGGNKRNKQKTLPQNNHHNTHTTCHLYNTTN